jgi:hypothetical protein
VRELSDDLRSAGATPEEAAQLATLLARAAEPARFEVPTDEVQRALVRVRPHARRRSRGPRVALGAAALAAAVVAVVLVLPHGVQDVQARALAAFGTDDTVLHLREDVTTYLPGARSTTRDVWYDPTHGRARWRDLSPDGQEFAETFVQPGRFERYLVFAHTRLVGSSCDVVAAGCAQLLDPVSRYRAVLLRRPFTATKTTFAGRATYRFVLPLQRSLDQVVYVDAETFLPRQIFWREDGRVVSTIEITDVERISADDVPAKAFAPPNGGRTVHVIPAGRLLHTKRLTLQQARRLHPYWLGRHQLRGIVLRTYEQGHAVVVRYRELDVWTYDRTVPPEVLAPRLSETKTVEAGGFPATFFPLRSNVALAFDRSPSLVIVGPEPKERLWSAVERVRRLR